MISLDEQQSSSVDEKKYDFVRRVEGPFVQAVLAALAARDEDGRTIGNDQLRRIAAVNKSCDTGAKKIKLRRLEGP